MARRKKRSKDGWYGNDTAVEPWNEDCVREVDVEDLHDSDEVEESGAGLAMMAGLSSDHPLINFYISEKADSFIDKYEPCNERDPMCVRFTESKLRSYFKAYVCTNGDPMKLYMLKLKIAGFNMSVSITGDPVMFVKEKHFPKMDNNWMLE